MNSIPSSLCPTAPDTALAFALFLARHEVAVFPCHRNKRPACANGFKDASSDPLVVQELWRRWPGELIGVPTGAINGLDVLDIDPRHGGHIWLSQHRDRLPPTRTHQTRSGGAHLLFRHADGLRCSASAVAPGVDCRADGGYIVWWPSAGFPVLDESAPIAWPSWLLDLLTGKPRAACVTQVASFAVPSPRTQGPAAHRAYAVGALHYAVVHVATAREGHRNVALNAEAFRLARFVGAGDLTPSEIADALAIAALRAGLSINETKATLASALGAGVVE